MAVLASGRGSNFRAILDHVNLGVLKGVKVGVLVYSDKDAGAASIARDYGVDAVHVQHRGVDRETREAQIRDAVSGSDLLVLAGYNYVLSSKFVEGYRWRIVNIHPSLLPVAGGKGMYGLRVHLEVLRSGSKVSGPTVHFVDEAVDGGPIIEQRPVYIGDIYGLPLDEADRARLLADRVLVYEHRLYPRVIQLVADGLVEVVEGEAVHARPVEDGSRIRVAEERVKVFRALVKAGPKWYAEWCGRQEAYVEYQREMWARMGKPLERVLGPNPWPGC